MTLDRPSACRCLPVTLRDVPAPVRLTAARQAARTAPVEALDLLAAAIDPSDTVYWVAASAALMLDEWQAAA